MMVQTTTRMLEKLSDTDLVLASKEEDIRGRSVMDSAGEKIGKVKDLMIDPGESKVRFLHVAGGGVLGIGDKEFMIPVDAITRIDEDNVYLSHNLEHVKGAPAYDPSLTPDDRFFEDVSGYWGYSPYWTAGYTYPPYPTYRRI
jgi:sporulation protein YlmC with PRC-barrel domain